MNVTENGNNFILHVPGTRKAEIAPLMAYRGLNVPAELTAAITRSDMPKVIVSPPALSVIMRNEI